jgi:hypothetical protein
LSPELKFIETSKLRIFFFGWIAVKISFHCFEVKALSALRVRLRRDSLVARAVDAIDVSSALEKEGSDLEIGLFTFLTALAP